MLVLVQVIQVTQTLVKRVERLLHWGWAMRVGLCSDGQWYDELWKRWTWPVGFTYPGMIPGAFMPVVGYVPAEIGRGVGFEQPRCD